VDFDHTVLTSTGERSPWLLAVGPELRVQARLVAETLLGNAHTQEQEGQLQLEYMI
jgi:hypothetical protein